MKDVARKPILHWVVTVLTVVGLIMVLLRPDSKATHDVAWAGLIIVLSCVPIYLLRKIPILLPVCGMVIFAVALSR